MVVVLAVRFGVDVFPAGYEARTGNANVVCCCETTSWMTGWTGLKRVERNAGQKTPTRLRWGCVVELRKHDSSPKERGRGERSPLSARQTAGSGFGGGADPISVRRLVEE